MSWHDGALPLASAAPGVLLVGNGPNRLSPGHSWAELLMNLQQAVGRRRSRRADGDKPFPLLYEELYLHGARQRQVPEETLIGLIADHTRDMAPNPVHEQLLALNVAHVLTTNYDHTLERALGVKRRSLPNAGVVGERRYSLFRRTDVAGKHLWHLHGDQATPTSIVLGYEHYSGTLERMRAYVTSQARYRGGPHRGLVARLRDGETRLRSWIDLFFAGDVYILGLDLDVSEIDLWWLLTYRARLQVHRPDRVRGTVRYLHARSVSGGGARQRRKLELLEATGVKLHGFERPDGDYGAFYERALAWLSRRLR